MYIFLLLKLLLGLKVLEIQEFRKDSICEEYC